MICTQRNDESIWKIIKDFESRQTSWSSLSQCSHEDALPFALAFAFTECVHIVPRIRTEDFAEINALMEVEVYKVIHAVFKPNPGVRPFPSASCFSQCPVNFSGCKPNGHWTFRAGCYPCYPLEFINVRVRVRKQAKHTAQRDTSEAVALFRSEYFAPPEGAAEAPQPMADTAKADAASGAEMSFAESLWLKLGGGFDIQTTWLFWISISRIAGHWSGNWKCYFQMSTS